MRLKYVFLCSHVSPPLTIALFFLLGCRRERGLFATSSVALVPGADVPPIMVAPEWVLNSNVRVSWTQLLKAFMGSAAMVAASITDRKFVVDYMAWQAGD